MEPTIVYTTEDPAGSSIAARLKESFGFTESGDLVARDGREFPCWSKGKVKLIEIGTRLANGSEFIADYPEVFKGDATVFLSRHRSESGKPCVTVHTTGNFTDSAEWGGRPKELSHSNAGLVAAALLSLKQSETADFPAVMEATHHGPTSIPWPVMFVEIGSSQAEWTQAKPADCVAQAALDAINKPLAREPHFGCGGGHYCPEFFRRTMDEGEAFAYVATKNSLESVDVATYRQAALKSVGGIKAIVVDRKGTLLAHRNTAKQAAEELGLELILA